MRSLSTEVAAALAAELVVARDFLWIVVRDRATGAAVADGQWSDIGTIDAQVINPNTGGSVNRTFYGTDTLTQISDIPLTASAQVQTVTIRMSQVNDRVEALVRQYDCKQAHVEIFRGLFSLETRELVAPAECRFVGFVDKIEIKTPAEDEEGQGGDGGVQLTCKSHTQEMTRANPALRSHESQQLRLAGDAFYKDTPTVGQWEHFWGRKTGKVPSTAGSGPEKTA